MYTGFEQPAQKCELITNELSIRFQLFILQCSQQVAKYLKRISVYGNVILLKQKIFHEGWSSVKAST